MQQLSELKKMVPRDFDNQFHEIFITLADSAEFCVFAGAKNNEISRDLVLKGLNCNYCQLANNTTPEDGLFFRSDLEFVMQAVETSNHLSQKLSHSSSSSKSFLES